MKIIKKNRTKYANFNQNSDIQKLCKIVKNLQFKETIK